MKNTLTMLVVSFTAAAVLVACWFGYWALSRKATDNRYDINTHSQQYQASLVSQERDRVQAYDAAVDPAQKANVKATFCQVYLTLTQPPADLASAHDRIC